MLLTYDAMPLVIPIAGGMNAWVRAGEGPYRENGKNRGFYPGEAWQNYEIVEKCDESAKILYE